MKRFNQFLENKIIPPMMKLSENKYIKVIEQSSQGMVSLLLIGSLFYLFASFPLNAWQNLISPYKHILIEAGKVSTESISLYILVAVSYYLSESYNKEGKDIDTLKMILLSIASFILFTNSSGSLEVSEIANVIDKQVYSLVHLVFSQLSLSQLLALNYIVFSIIKTCEFHFPIKFRQWFHNLFFLLFLCY